MKKAENSFTSSCIEYSVQRRYNSFVLESSMSFNIFILFFHLYSTETHLYRILNLQYFYNEPNIHQAYI